MAQAILAILLASAIAATFGMSPIQAEKFRAERNAWDQGHWRPEP